MGSRNEQEPRLGHCWGGKLRAWRGLRKRGAGRPLDGLGRGGLPARIIWQSF